MSVDAYGLAQHAVADLKTAILHIIEGAGEQGLTNAQIGRSLGIYAGHVGHEGHISRTMLSLMENDGVVQQDAETKQWRIKTHSAADEEHPSE